MHHASSHITLAKGQHRESTVIWLQFSGRRDWLELIKGLGCIQYSRTHSTWYIPYDKVAYNDFKQLALKHNIPIILSGTHAEGHQASEGEPAPGHDITSISTDTSRDTVSPSTGIEVTDIHSKASPTIERTGKGFVIRMLYQKQRVEEVKTLEGAWWNQKHKVLQCKQYSRDNNNQVVRIIAPP